MNSNITTRGVIWTVALLIIGGLLDQVFPIYGSQIRDILGATPTLYYQTDFIGAVNGTGTPIYRISAYNKSNRSGDLVIKVGGQFEESDFSIDGNSDRPVVQTDVDNTYINFPSIYPEETVTVVVKKIILRPVSVQSQAFRVKEVYSFPYELKYPQHSILKDSLLLIFIFFGSFVIIFWLFYNFFLEKFLSINNKNEKSGNF